ncbi:EAL domain-containing protein [Tissierella carlieri]|jgi:diguanylate cyclase (GGDEF)-like protein/PAS domain S-box-containing protein|uniref:sensor domain-containing protein n=1 Tax=Tissierella carlieri TaxID=689904 RepID=UPI001C10F530|nr:EAL domain-containing protein [Tissierella carlieri]MBU5312364.1 EAL domain-containing protein [Tissierella carlieri]
MVRAGKRDLKDLLNLKDLLPKKEALRTSIIYFILSFIWIQFSDEFFYKIIGNTSKYKDIQKYKGWTFIFLTTVLIYFSIYERLKKVKDMGIALHKSMEELSATTEGLLTTQEKLNREQILSENIFKNSTLIIFTWNLDGSIISFNPYGEKVTGYKEEEIIGESWIDLFLYEDEKPKVKGLVEYLKSGRSIKNSIGDVWRSKDNRIIELIWTDSPIYDEDGNVTQIISFGTDITDHKKLLRRLNELAYYDTLTGLPNRIMLKNEAGKLIKDAKLNNIRLGFLYIDIDNFTQINDTLGHDAGDDFLIHLAKILKEENKDGNILAKLSEDEYAIILYNVEDRDDIIRKTEYILKEIRKPWCIDKEEFIISASIGISIFPHNGDNYSDLMRSANMAMYNIKSKGKNGYAFYEAEMGKRIADNTFMINQVRRAIEEEQFTLHYQPVINMEDNTIYGAECLIRWYHPEKGYIPPMDYIPLIEETGQIFDVTSLILKMAFNQKKLLNEKGYSYLKLSVNISNKSLIKGGLDNEIVKLLEEYKIKPEEITIEITETSFMGNLEGCIYTLTKLEELGIEIALDDFGTGYSSLAQLKRLPIHNVKMDQEFIKTMKKNSEEEVVVKSIIELAHTLGLKIIAEGIETKEQQEILLESKCDLGQGYYLGKPMNAESFQNMLMMNKRVNINE